VTIIAPFILYKPVLIKPFIAINIVEAVVQDIILKRLPNAIVGISLIGSLAIYSPILVVHNLYTWWWVISYMGWNMLFCKHIGISSRSSLIHNGIPVYLWICSPNENALLIWAIARMISISVMQLDYLMMMVNDKTT
jgi:hypothetical protein